MSEKQFKWPQNKKAGVSITFDDARFSQPDVGIPILNNYNVKATFYISPGNMEHRLSDWEQIVADGHEIGNHTMTHPCSGNFSFARNNALENYTLERMEDDILSANEIIMKKLGVLPSTFAYPCGQKFVGRELNTKSYVPLIAKHFIVGRSAFDEVHNDPVFADLAQAAAMDFDSASFEKVKSLIERTLMDGGWLILFGHEIGTSGGQTILADTLEKLCQYAQEPANGIWIDTVANIGKYILQNR